MSLHVPISSCQTAATYKQHFEESLESVQTQILAHFNVTEEELEEATDYYKDDAEISTLVTELESFYVGKYDQYMYQKLYVGNLILLYVCILR